MHKEAVVTITIDMNGNILNKSDVNHYLFKDCKNIFDLQPLDKYKDVMVSELPEKRKLINLFEHNYAVYKIPLPVSGIILNQLIFEEFCINNFFTFNKSQIVYDNLKDIESYSTQQQEVIFALLNGYIQNKEILNFMLQHNLIKRIDTERTIKTVISQLYVKFGVNNKSSLVSSLNAHGLNKHFPKTIFKPGLY